MENWEEQNNQSFKTRWNFQECKIDFKEHRVFKETVQGTVFCTLAQFLRAVVGLGVRSQTMACV